MSLIVARQENNFILIVSDTKLTYPLINTKSLKNNVEDGVLKSVVIGDSICISFAGVVDFAEAAVKEIAIFSHSVEKILAVLFHYHQLSIFETEFILCANLEYPVIYEVKDNCCKAVLSAWIGDQKAFSKFQSCTNTKPKSTIASSITFTQTRPSSSLDKMSSAMDAVISDSTIESVGGFKVEIALRGKKFRYEHYMNMNREQLHIMLFGGVSNMVPIGHGTPENGAYSLSFIGASDDGKHVALHILQGKLGILFSRHDSGLLRPQIMRNMDEVDFHDYIKNYCKIYPPFTTQDRFQKFNSEAISAFQKREFTKACKLFEKASTESNGTRKAETLFNLGMSLHLIKNPRALEVFKQALEIDSSLQNRILQFIKTLNQKYN